MNYLRVFWLILFMTGIHVHGATMELYGTFHAMGITVHLDPGDDPDENAETTVLYRIHSGSGLYETGHYLSRVDSDRFVGSLFWLSPGTEYDVAVTFDDPGGVLHGTTLNQSGLTREETFIPVPASQFFVTPEGSGSVCTQGNPCSLDEALDQAQPGDEIVLRGGIYAIGELTPPRSGTAGNPITIRAFSGETPVCDGSDPGSFAWTDLGNGIYQTTLNTGDTHLVMADTERIYPYQNYDDMAGLIWGISGFYCSGTTLYVHLSDGSDPTLHTMTISRYNHMFYMDSRNHFIFEGLTFRYYGQGSYAKVLYFNNASDSLIENCTFEVNDLGIGIKRDSHRNVIQDCMFNDTIFDWPWDAVKAGASLETGGIRFYDPCTGRGTIIRRNTFEDYFDGFGACPGSTSGETNETDVYENTAYNIGDDCIETDGECSNVRIWNNTFHDTLVGISVAPVYTGPVYAIRNLIYRTGAGNNSYPGSPFKFNSGYGLSGPMFLYHNTSDAVLPGNHGLDIKSPGTWTGITARNNIWVGTEYGMRNYNTSNPTDLDYDNISTTGTTLVYWDSTHYTTLADFSTATGQEIHGMSHTPVFEDAGAGVYYLVNGSPLEDAGVLIPGINQQYEGSGPDIGAFETSAATPTPTATPYCPHHGDVDLSGSITAGDAQRAFEIALGAFSPTFEEFCAADCNGDNEVTAGDAQTIFAAALGMGSCLDPV